MPKASVTRLINQTKDKLIEFVLDIDKYPEFIPFCDSSKIYERKDDGQIINIIADLTIGKGPFKDTFKSDVNYIKKKDHIHVVNIGGPLNYLENNWRTKVFRSEKASSILRSIDSSLIICKDNSGNLCLLAYLSDISFSFI